MSTSQQPSDETALTERLTTRWDKQRLAQLEARVDEGEHANVSQAIRDAVDEMLEVEDAE